MRDMIYIDRTIEPVIERASRRFKVVAVTGMRKVGKSTLLRHMAENRPRMRRLTIEFRSILRLTPEKCFSSSIRRLF